MKYISSLTYSIRMVLFMAILSLFGMGEGYGQVVVTPSSNKLLCVDEAVIFLDDIVVSETSQNDFGNITGQTYILSLPSANFEFITTGCGCDNTSSPFENFNLVPDPQPFSVDIDCDGDADMLAGGDGELFFFENNGDDTYTDKQEQQRISCQI